MRIAYEWMPDSQSAWNHRDVLEEALNEMARTMEDVAIQLDCQSCKRVLFQRVNQYRKWAGELTDRRRRKVPMIHGTVQDWKDRGRPFLALAEAEGGGGKK